MHISLVSTRYSHQIVIELGFSQQIFEKNTQTANFMKIRPVRAEMLHADRRADGRT